VLPLMPVKPETTSSLIGDQSLLPQNGCGLSRDEYLKIRKLSSSLRENIQQSLSRSGNDELLLRLSRDSCELVNILQCYNSKLATPKSSEILCVTSNQSRAPLNRPKTNNSKLKCGKRSVSDGRPSPQHNVLSLQPPSKKKKKPQRKPTPQLPEELYCRSCGETQTCEWRRGPDGYKSLCNACGIHFAKVVKKEAALSYEPKGEVKLNMLLN